MTPQQLSASTGRGINSLPPSFYPRGTEDSWAVAVEEFIDGFAQVAVKD